MLAALLLLGASGSACRTLDVPDRTIAAVIWQIGRGAIRSGLPELAGGDRQRLSVELDGQSLDGWRYLLAAGRVGLYVLDLYHAGRVELWRGDRHYVIEDNQASVTVRRTVYHRVLRRTIAVHVCVTIVTTESAGGTRFVGRATGCKTGCLGSRQISAGLADALQAIESLGRRAYDAGDAAEAVVTRFASR